jgi:hypothetical protein
MADESKVCIAGGIANAICDATAHAKALPNRCRAFVRLEPFRAAHAHAMLCGIWQSINWHVLPLPHPICSWTRAAKFLCPLTSAIRRVRLRTSRGWTCWADLPSPVDERNSCAARPSILGLSVDLNLENGSWHGKCLFYEFPTDSAGLDLCPSRPAGIALTCHGPGVEVEKAVIRLSVCVWAKHIRRTASLAFRDPNA